MYFFPQDFTVASLRDVTTVDHHNLIGDKALDTLRGVFYYRQFRGCQKKSIHIVLSGQATKNSSSAETSLSGANIKKSYVLTKMEDTLEWRIAQHQQSCTRCLRKKKATLIQYSPDVLSDFFKGKF